MKITNILSALALGLGILSSGAARAMNYCDFPPSQLSSDDLRSCLKRQGIIAGNSGGGSSEYTANPYHPMPPGGWHDPASIDLCPKPRRMTDDMGCQ